MRTDLQGFDDRNARARDAAAMRCDQVAGRDGNEGGMRVVWHCDLELIELLMQHCSI